jgi:hypothetical protein
MGSNVKDDVEILKKFINVYCNTKHKSEPKTNINNISLCDECHDTLHYSISRRMNCPLNPKPMCKKCEIHCYKTEYRQKIKDIMRHSGRVLIRRGRIDLILHYLF